MLSYRDNLKELSEYRISRCYILSSNITSSHLIGFCDASLKAYCAVVYYRTVNQDGIVNNSFVCAKTRVAPLKGLTIPRLELLAAVMLSQLINRIGRILNIDNENVFLFSDSTTVLSWINHPIHQLKQFVANRATKILSLTIKSHWLYVDTKSNHADLRTRGISAESFLKNKIWRNGPEWLKSNSLFDSYISASFKSVEELPDVKVEKNSLPIQRGELYL